MVESKGIAAFSSEDQFRPFAFERRSPKENDVLIDVKFCGVCHSDVHQKNADWSSKNIYPMVAGHEVVGVVSKVGSKVSKFKVGDRVGVGTLVDSCRKCKLCKENREQYCEKGPVMAYNSKFKDDTKTYGGYSNNMVVDENFVLRIPENMESPKVAPLLCAGITMFSPMRQYGIGKGSRLGIVGLGGLGHIGVQIGKAMGAEVSVFSRTSKKEKDAKKLGAGHFYATEENKDALKELKKSFDLIITTSSSKIDWNLYLPLLKVDGTFVLVGIPTEKVGVDASKLIMGGVRIAGSLIGGIKETQEMLDFCSKHDISAKVEKIRIQEVNKAFEQLQKGKAKYRFVIDMESVKDLPLESKKKRTKKENEADTEEYLFVKKETIEEVGQ